MKEVITLRPDKNLRGRSREGTESSIELLDALYPNVRFTWLEEHEARHAVVAIVMGTGAFEASNVAEGNSGGHVLMKKQNLIAFAASHNMPGHSYDKAYVEAHGENFEALGSIADGIVERNISLMRAIARALLVERTLNETRLSQIEDQSRNGGRVKIRVTTRDGRVHEFEMRTHDGEDVTVEVPLVEDEPGNDAVEGEGREKNILASNLPMWEREPISEKTLALHLRKTA